MIYFLEVRGTILAKIFVLVQLKTGGVGKLCGTTFLQKNISSIKVISSPKMLVSYETTELVLV